VWKDYSTSLYYIKKNPSGESIKYHKDLLLTIMEESKNGNVRVPPGVYCEYGYILLKEGKKEEAFTYFDLEERTYPESQIFIQNLKMHASKQKNKDNLPAKDNTGDKEGDTTRISSTEGK
ncbi:MAG: DUF4810 domain-containing protein, partial [Syntrophorhabdaceae bacterium]